MLTRKLSTTLVLGFGLALALLWLLGAGQTPIIRAADLGVTRFDDPPPGECTDMDCSLREAIRAANANSDADTILLGMGTYTWKFSK